MVRNPQRTYLAVKVHTTLFLIKCLWVHMLHCKKRFTSLKGNDVQVRLYFQRDLLDLAHLQNITFGSNTKTQLHSDRDISYDYGSDDSNVHNVTVKTYFDKVSLSKCDGTKELDCFAVRLTPSNKLRGRDLVQYVKYYHLLLFQEENSRSMFHDDYFLRSLQGINDEILSQLVKIEARLIQTDDGAEFNATIHSYLYEEPYTLKLYFPMISFLVVNLLALLVGLFLFLSNTCEERRDEILERHKENQDRIIRDATLNTMEVESMSIESEMERHKIDGLVLSLDASNDEAIEVKVTDH